MTAFILAARSLRQTLQQAISIETDESVHRELVCADHYVGMAQHRAAAGQLNWASSAMEAASACVQFGMTMRRLHSRPV